MFKAPIATLALGLLLLFIGCIENPVDGADPEISLSSFNGDQEVFSGNALSFSVECFDDVNLASVEVVVTCPESEWSETESFEVLGESVSLNGQVLLGEDLLTEICTASIRCMDQDDNSSSTETFDFQVVSSLDGSGPLITLETVNAISLEADTIVNNGITFFKGQSFDITGTLKDLASGILEGGAFIENDIQVFPSPIVFDLEFNPMSDIDTLATFNSSAELISPTQIGTFDLVIHATDSTLNYTERVFPISVIE